MLIRDQIIALYEAKPAVYNAAERDLYDNFIGELNFGRIRAAEKIDDIWQVHAWVKMGILIGFRMGVLEEMAWSSEKSFFDKDTLPEKKVGITDQIRIVPGGSSIRNGCYIAPGVGIMPPAFINIGSYIGSGTLVDSHALVGSCAQIGKNVHLSAGAMIGGVLEPIGNRPVIIEDDVFIGGNCGVYEGVIIKQRAVLASGTIITAATPVFDAVNGNFLLKEAGLAVTIPQDAVVVPGSRSLKGFPEFNVYCPIIIKYRDAKTAVSVSLEQDLRGLIN